MNLCTVCILSFAHEQATESVAGLGRHSWLHAKVHYVCIYVKKYDYWSAYRRLYLRRFLVYLSSFHLFCSPIQELSNSTKFRPLRGGAQKSTKKNRTLVTDSVIDQSVQNALLQPCGRAL